MRIPGGINHLTELSFLKNPLFEFKKMENYSLWRICSFVIFSVGSHHPDGESNGRGNGYWEAISNPALPMNILFVGVFWNSNSALLVEKYLLVSWKPLNVSSLQRNIVAYENN